MYIVFEVLFIVIISGSSTSVPFGYLNLKFMSPQYLKGPKRGVQFP